MGEESEAFAEWVDTAVVAEAVMNGLECSTKKQSAENAKKVWLDFLGTELNEGIGRSVMALEDKNELEEA